MRVGKNSIDISQRSGGLIIKVDLLWGFLKYANVITKFTNFTIGIV